MASATTSNITLTLAGGGGGGASIATAGSHGQVITVANGTGANWANPSPKMTASGQLHLEGANADLVINGVKLSDTLNAINNRLSILQPDPKLLAKYENLREAYEHYKTLEALLHQEGNDE